jgi:hypothetical protein
MFDLYNTLRLKREKKEQFRDFYFFSCCFLFKGIRLLVEDHNVLIKEKNIAPLPSPVTPTFYRFCSIESVPHIYIPQTQFFIFDQIITEYL